MANYFLDALRTADVLRDADTLRAAEGLVADALREAETLRAACALRAAIALLEAIALREAETLRAPFVLEASRISSSPSGSTTNCSSPTVKVTEPSPSSSTSTTTSSPVASARSSPTSSASKRSVDAYHKWHRYYDVGVTDECYRNLESVNNVEFMIEQIKNVLNDYFCTEANCSVEPCIEEALNKGEDMLMLYKSKQTFKRKADIYLQLLDNGMYCPNLFVYDEDGAELLHKKLPCTFDLMSLGEIQLSNKKVVVKPRKNSLASQLEPVEFELR